MKKKKIIKLIIIYLNAKWKIQKQNKKYSNIEEK
jgi:hypothetical protein